MAQRKRDVVVSQTAVMKEHRLICVYIAPYLLPELLKIEGLKAIDLTYSPTSPTCFISPLYDMDEVIAEIENLGTPIPEAFLEVEGEPDS